LIREQLAAAQSGDQPATDAARTLLRDRLLVGEIKLVPEGRALHAEFALSGAALLVSAGPKGLGNQEEIGSGGVICAVPSVPQSVRVK